MTKEELKKRTKSFAIKVFKFLMEIEKNKAVDVITYQLFKSSSSVAANYRAVCRGKSESDFLNKLKIVDEEADESLFWLEFIKDCKEANRIIVNPDVSMNQPVSAGEVDIFTAMVAGGDGGSGSNVGTQFSSMSLNNSMNGGRRRTYRLKRRKASRRRSRRSYKN